MCIRDSVGSEMCIRDRIEIDKELLNSMIFTSRITKYIETNNDGNVIKLFDEQKKEQLQTYTFNPRHGIYLNDKNKGSVECLNIVDFEDDSEEPDPDNGYNINYVELELKERNSEKSERRSFRNSFTSTCAYYGEEETLDGIFILGDIFV
jgi:hypothetical protein